MKQGLTNMQQAVLWAVDGGWCNTTQIDHALHTDYAQTEFNLDGWPKSHQGIVQSASSLVRRGLIRKNLMNWITVYRKA